MAKRERNNNWSGVRAERAGPFLVIMATDPASGRERGIASIWNHRGNFEANDCSEFYDGKFESTANDAKIIRCDGEPGKRGWPTSLGWFPTEAEVLGKIRSTLDLPELRA